MRRFKVSIQRSELLTIPDQVGEWEIPILQLVHGAEVVSIGDFTKDLTPYPAASVEYERLERRFGENPSTGVSRVAEVYGPSPGGIRVLHQAIKDAAKEQSTPESVTGNVAFSDELNEEIAPPTTEVTDMATSTPATPVEIAKANSKAQAKQTPKKQIIGKQPAKAAVVPTPKQPTEPLADAVAIEE